MTESNLPLATRLWFAWVCFFRVLFDGAFAARVLAVREPGARLPAPAAEPARAAAAREPAAAAPAPERSLDSALELLSLLQREGRFVDFVQQEIETFGDADVAAAARVVHAGCRRAIAAHASIVSVRQESEGSSVWVDGAAAAAEVKLTGNVQGSAPYRGVLRHRGWRVASLKLPTRVGVRDVQIVAPAEVEL